MDTLGIITAVLAAVTPVVTAFVWAFKRLLSAFIDNANKNTKTIERILNVQKEEARTAEQRHDKVISMLEKRRARNAIVGL